MMVHTTSTSPTAPHPRRAGPRSPGTNGGDAVAAAAAEDHSDSGSGPEDGPDHGTTRPRERIPDPAQRTLRTERRRQFRREVRRAARQDALVASLTEAMLGTFLQKKKAQRRRRLRGRHVSFREDRKLCAAVEFDEDEAPKRITDPHHVSEDHSDIPWDEWEAEPLTNWWDQPDLHEDDEVTKLCKRVLIASASKDIGEGNLEIKADKIHALVIKFVLKVQQRVQERRSRLEGGGGPAGEHTDT